MPDIATGIGAGVSLLGQNKAAKAQDRASAAAERQAELAYERSKPWDVKGHFGEAQFDEEGKQLNLSLSQPWQSEYDIAMQGAKDQRSYIAEMEADPMAAGKKFYDMQKAIYAPEQEQARLSQENRLLSQGMLGSTGGASRIEALRKAQEMQDLEAQYAGLDKAQGMIDTYRGRSATDLGMAETIGQMPQKYAQTGLSIGSNLGTAAASAAKLSSSAAQARGASQANKWLSIGTQFGDLYGGQGGDGMFGDFGRGLGNFNTANTFTTNPWSEQTAMLADQRMGY